METLEPVRARSPGAPGGSVADEPAFEARGIDYIPLSERRGRPIDLVWMWAGALFNVEYVVYGALIVAFGLSLLAGGAGDRDRQPVLPDRRPGQLAGPGRRHLGVHHQPGAVRTQRAPS